MKGIVLAGGSGTRLGPLTKSISKQLLPVYNKPMIYYPLNTLKQMGLKDILIITTPLQQELFKQQLGNGSEFGLNLSYKTQVVPKGIADAFIIGEDFIGDDSVTLILGDNIFINDPSHFIVEDKGCVIYGYQVQIPSKYGVFEFDSGGLLKRIVEKPDKFISDYACVGLYVFDNSVIEKAKKVQPSLRGELEITDVINQYIDENNYYYVLLEPGDAWFDCGNCDDLLECAEFIRALKERANIKIGL